MAESGDAVAGLELLLEPRVEIVCSRGGGVQHVEGWAGRAAVQGAGERAPRRQPRRGQAGAGAAHAPRAASAAGLGGAGGGGRGGAVKAPAPMPLSAITAR